MITQLVTGITFAALLVYDAFCGSIGQPTISNIMRDWGKVLNVWPYAWGLFLGHWFSPKANARFDQVGYVLVPAALLLIFDIIYLLAGGEQNVWYRYPLLWALVGVVMGFFFWEQSGGIL